MRIEHALYSLLFIEFLLLVIAITMVIKSKSSNRDQKLFQILFSVFLPFIGSSLTIAVHWSDRMK